MRRILRVEACLRQGVECHEGVTRRGELQPCDRPAVALRNWVEGDTYYPVCPTHTRGFCIPLVAPEDTAALVAALRAVLTLADGWQEHAEKVTNVYGKQVVSVEFARAEIVRAIEEALR